MFLFWYHKVQLDLLLECDIYIYIYIYIYALATHFIKQTNKSKKRVVIYSM